tara:strand:+ start:136 stop:366 length:231 start_codon:yes stop_codon:yes gene_type:complete
MEIERLNIYERLRDFKVPSSILDSIFSDESDAAILIDAFKALVDDGFKEDQAAEKISEMIFKELKINPNQSMEDEK